MNKQFIVATLVGAVTLFLAGFLIWGLALAGWMETNFSQALAVDPPNWLWLVISNILWAAFFTYVFTKWANISTWKSGATAGLILGLLMAAAYDTGWYSMTTLFTGGLAAMIVDIIANGLWWAIGAAAIGFTLGKVTD